MFYVKITNEGEDRADKEKSRYIFQKKCYICESELTKGGHIEHRIPKCAGKKFETLNSNLFWACLSCNGKKGYGFYEPSNECQYTDGYCGIIDCTKCDPNKYIGIRFIDELRTEIEIFEKKYAPCNKHTIPLLKKIHCPQGEMDDADLRELKNEIINYLGPLKMQMSKLFNDYKSNAPESEMNEDKKNILDCASPDKPFFAIKYTYIEDLRNKSGENGFGEILNEILADPSFHPVENDCCSHKDSDSD